MLFNPVKRALRNGIFLSIAVGIIVGWQGESIWNALTSALFTFSIITPAFWLSYKWANKLAAKHRDNDTTL
jgi:ABC-type dipeptide/oligopeptide/nickel transport system permease component